MKNTTITKEGWEEFHFGEIEGGVGYWRKGIYKVTFYPASSEEKFDKYYASFVNLNQKNWGDSVDGCKKHRTLKEAISSATHHSNNYEPSAAQIRNADKCWENWKSR